MWWESHTCGNHSVNRWETCIARQAAASSRTAWKLNNKIRFMFLLLIIGQVWIYRVSVCLKESENTAKMVHLCHLIDFSILVCLTVCVSLSVCVRELQERKELIGRCKWAVFSAGILQLHMSIGFPVIIILVKYLFVWHTDPNFTCKGPEITQGRQCTALQTYTSLCLIQFL